MSEPAATAASREPATAWTQVAPPAGVLISVALAGVIGFVVMVAYVVEGGAPEAVDQRIVTSFVMAGVILVVVSFTVALVPYRLRVGADGVAQRGPGRERFVPFADVVDIGTEPSGASLGLRTSERVMLGIGTGPLLDVIRRRFLAQHRAARAAVPSLLQRGDRTTQDWAARLLHADAGDAGAFRDASIERESLLCVVEDLGAEPRVRVAAAAVLCASTDAVERERIRAAADATAATHAREALFAVARTDVDGDALRAALERALA